jgi:carbon storage regulator
MLVLTRKKNESIIIADNIELTILELQGDQVKIGIKAPKEVEIFRKEIIVKIEVENKKAIEGNIDFKNFLKKNNKKG